MNNFSCGETSNNNDSSQNNEIIDISESECEILNISNDSTDDEIEIIGEFKNGNIINDINNKNILNSIQDHNSDSGFQIINYTSKSIGGNKTKKNNNNNENNNRKT